MNTQPKFLDSRGKPILKRRKRPHGLAPWQRILFTALIVVLGPILFIGAVTQIDLAHQVKGTLPIGNGGTGAASLGAGVIRSNASVLSSAELSGDATTSTSNAVTVVKVNGTSVTTNSAADQVILTTASATASWASVTNCANALQYSTSTHLFGCSGALLSGTFVDAETPTSSCNGSNQTFGVAHTPSPSTSLQLFLNGQRMYYTDDFTLATATITSVFTCQTGDKLLATYRY